SPSPGAATSVWGSATTRVPRATTSRRPTPGGSSRWSRSRRRWAGRSRPSSRSVTASGRSDPATVAACRDAGRSGSRRVPAYVREGPVAVGRCFAREPEQPLADDVPLDLVAAAREGRALTPQPAGGDGARVVVVGRPGHRVTPGELEPDIGAEGGARRGEQLE